MVLHCVAKWMTSRAQKMECEVMTVSDIIRIYSLEKIDLLKIDVERAELMVLQGIEPKDWQRIRQVSAEVHTENLDSFVSLLTHEGKFSQVVKDQSHDMKNTSLFMVFAHR